MRLGADDGHGGAGSCARGSGAMVLRRARRQPTRGILRRMFDVAYRMTPSRRRGRSLGRAARQCRGLAPGARRPVVRGVALGSDPGTLLVVERYARARPTRRTGDGALRGLEGRIGRPDRLERALRRGGRRDRPRDLRDALRVRPGSRVRLPARRGRHPRLDQGVGRAGARAPAGPARRPPGPALGGGEAVRPRRPPGHRCGRQGRHDQQGHGGVQPAGLPGHLVQGPERRGARPRLPVADPQGASRARARSASSTARTTRTSSSSASTTSCPKPVWSARYDQINDFERHLADNGTTIVKFFLSIDRDEQRERFQARYDDPTKRWKFSMGDLEERERWDDYQAAFDEALTRTSTDGGPVVRHPGQPQVVPQPRGGHDPRRHDRRPASRATRRSPRTCRRTSSSSRRRPRRSRGPAVDESDEPGGRRPPWKPPISSGARPCERALPGRRLADRGRGPSRASLRGDQRRRAARHRPTPSR